MLEKLKTFVYHSINEEEDGKNCGCKDHDHEDPLECSCCDPCMLYHENLTLRNSITSATTLDVLKELFEDDIYEWFGFVDGFITSVCQGEQDVS